ncbi:MULTISPECIES: hypothetical protein [Psychrobacter]|uniref:hypothetical protein n=1 Tax=Psychrobacter TaxID=497 RepID=UPI00146A18D6|nr:MULTISPECIES: hypothetical protein [Psychrobacter]
MNKLILAALCLTPTFSIAANIPNDFNSKPVLPTVEKLRNEAWTWSNFSKLPKIGKLERDGNYKNRYMMTQTIRSDNPETTITFYGTKERPEAAIIETRSWGAANTQNSSFVRLDKLKGVTPLTSNCNFKKVSLSDNDNDVETGATLEFQQAYLLPKHISSLSNAKNNLYMASSQVETYVITSTYQTQAYTMSIITPDKAKLGQFVNDYGWNKNSKGKTISCKVS